MYITYTTKEGVWNQTFTNKTNHLMIKRGYNELAY